ncbi:TPA: toprim domain-containing protein [Providencia rettgeri]|nr:toprim domain-containing protein [Providencia rettgeri]
MKPIDVIRDVKLKANGQWQNILSNLGAEVPLNTHTACPHCGGKDRFRFDDKDGNGTFICSQCGSGDGLDLVQRVLGGSVTEAAYEVAGMIGIDTRSDNPPAYRSHEVKAQQDALKAQQAQSQANEQIEKHKRFTARYNRTIAKAKQGESEYLKAKGFDSTTVTLLSDGSLIIPLIDTDGTITAAQTIKPNGDKRLLLDSTKNGSYYPINEPVNVSTVIIAEGLATAMTCQLIQPEAHTVVAIDAGNLIHVAKVMRAKYPESKIIIAGDNDIKPDQDNTGKLAAERAAKAVNGITVLPPTDDKADWDDYRLSHGIEAAIQAFNEALGQQGGKAIMKPKNTKRKMKPRNNLTQLADNEKALLLAEQYEGIAVHPESEGFYTYQQGVWLKTSFLDLSREMGRVYMQHNTNFSKRALNNVVEALKIVAPVMEEPCQSLIPFSNGVFDIKTKLFSPHSPSNWLLNHNGIEYTPAKPDENLRDDAPNFHKWIDHAANSDPYKIKRIFAALYMVLANRYDWQLFLEITGEGGSGKSVFTQVATLLAGQHNTASGNMAALDTARGRAQFVGKSMITLPDQPKYTGEGTGIKAITGGDAVEIDPKHEQQYTEIIRAVVIATNNTPMIFTERAGGVARRRVIFQFNNKVKDEDKDPLLSKKIAEEIPVIVRRLLATFDDPEEAKMLLIEQRDSAEALEVKRASNPVLDLCAALAFMGEPRGLEMGGGRKVEEERQPRKYLYHLYLSFIEYQGLGRPLSVTEFGKAIKEAAKEYKSEYLTRTIQGRRQTNVQLTDDVNEFL